MPSLTLFFPFGPVDVLGTRWSLLSGGDEDLHPRRIPPNYSRNSRALFSVDGSFDPGLEVGGSAG